MTRTQSITDAADVNPRAPRSLFDDADRRVHFLPMANLGEDGTIALNGERTVQEVSTGYTYFENGDVLVAKITPCMENGKAALVHNLPLQVGFGSTEFHVLRPRAHVDGRYLFYMVWSDTFRRQAERQMTGSAGQKRVPTAFFKRFVIPLPPLAEQKRIAAILDKADALHRKRREAVESTRKMPAALFADLFGESTSISKAYSVAPLRDHLSFITSGSRGWARYYSTSGAKFLRIQNVGRNELLETDVAFVRPPDDAEARRTRVAPNDVLISVTADLGRTAVVPDDIGEAYINQHLMLLRVREIEPVFLAQYIASAGGQAQIARLNRAAVKAGLNFNDVQSLLIPRPPLDAQRRFASSLHRSRDAERTAKSAVSEAESLFNSLVHRAFRGEL